MVRKSKVSKKQDIPEKIPIRPTPKWFYAVAVLIPVIFFILLEIFLRIINYGNKYNVFISESKAHPDRLVLNPEIAQKYFTNLKHFPIPTSEAFDKIKKPNTFRIFVLGESSVQGFPYVVTASFPDDLKRRLELLYPDKNIEVINCGISAINSFTIRDFTPAVIKQKPDLILIYTGHNEYYGALGVASSFSGGKFRSLVNFYIELQKFRSVQLIDNFVEKIATIFKSKSVSNQNHETLMEQVVGRSLIPLNSALYNLGVKQFEGNMNDILSLFKGKNIPVILGTLTSNLKNLAPFVSVKENKLPSADSIYSEARNSLKSGNPAEAKKLFIEAKDLDELRFRAPEIFNSIIKKLGNKFNYPVVNIDSIFNSSSPQGIVGNNLIIDHLHPNIDGCKLLAKSYYEKMNEMHYLPGNETKYIPEYVQDSILNRNFPYTKLDSTIGNIEIHILTGSYPFVQRETSSYSIGNFVRKNYVDTLAVEVLQHELSWEKAHAILAGKYYDQKNYSNFKNEMDAILDQHSHYSNGYKYVINNLIEAKLFDDALPYLQKLNSFEPSYFTTKWLGTIALQKGNYQSALNYLQQCIEYNQNDSQVWYNLAGAFYYNNRLNDALNAVEKSLSINPNNSLSYKFYIQLKSNLQSK